MEQWFVFACAGLLGLILGSLLNVVISRIPTMTEMKLRMEAFDLLSIEIPDRPTFNLFLPRSHCPVCKTPLHPMHMVPILSWFLLRAKCATCGAKISPRYPLIEFNVCLLSILAVLVSGISLEAAVLIVGTSLLVALATIDLGRGLLPNELTYPLLFLGLVASVALPTSPFLAPVESGVIGAVIGYVSFWLINHAFRLVTGRDGMGEGDFKLNAAIGAWIGWELMPYMIVFAFALALVFALLQLFKRTYSLTAGIPFGAFLAFAAIVTIFLHDQIYTWTFLRA